MKHVNEVLLSIQKEWLSEIVAPFMSKGYKEQFSRPFHFGVSEQLDTNKKLIMIIGQEADRFWKFEDEKITPEYTQRWCVGYFEKQVFNTTFKEFDEFNASPFWHFFRMLHKNGVELCWNNIDKLHRYKTEIINGVSTECTETLTVEYEKQLSVQYGDDKQSLLQREIEVVKPDAVVFVTGPYYQDTMCTAFGVKDAVLRSTKPTMNDPCIEISAILGLDIPAFWTYHPRFLVMHSFVDYTVAKILEKCKN